MALFRYRAINAAGEAVEGELEGRSEAAVIQRLQDTGFLPIEARPSVERAAAASGGISLGRRRLKPRDVTLLTRELAILLGAGQPLEQALEALAQGTEVGAAARTAQAVLDQVRGGSSLSAAFEAQGPAFPRLYTSMVRAGESSGTLELVLDRLADLRERSERVREMVVSAMLYPIILIVVSLAAVYLLLTFVVPQFETIFEDAGAALPTPTIIVIAIGRALEAYGWIVLLGILAMVLVGRRILAIPGPRRRWDGAMLRLPLVGGFIRMLATARFCRTLATLVGNGVDVPTAIALSRDVVPNRAVAEAMDRVITGVRQGRGIAEPLAETGIFAPLAIQMLRVGEETGRIDMTAAHVADAYERKLETQIKRMVTLVEPTLIIVLGLAVGGIVMSILLAVISINDLAF